jgi:hypothetical protein
MIAIGIGVGPFFTRSSLQRPGCQWNSIAMVGALGVARDRRSETMFVVEAGGVLRLAAELLHELLVGGVALVQHLQRHGASELLVLGEVSSAIPPEPSRRRIT